jgi:hypothetical protein
VRTFFCGAAVGTRTIAGDFMTRDEVKTIFSVYQIWLQEGRDATMAKRPEGARVAQIVHRRVKSPPSENTAHQCLTSSPDARFLAS